MTSDQPRAPQLPPLAVGVAVSLAYVLAAHLGFRVAVVAEQITTVCPTGIALATFLLCGVRFWPAVCAGAFLANISAAAPLWTAAVIASGNTMESVAATAPRRGARRDRDRRKRRGGVRFNFPCDAATSCGRCGSHARNGDAGGELEVVLEGVAALVVDDDADARELIRYVLHNRGALVTTAASGEALHTLANHAFDVLVADIGIETSPRSITA